MATRKYPVATPKYPMATPTYPTAGPRYPPAGPTYPPAGPTYPPVGPTYPIPARPPSLEDQIVFRQCIFGGRQGITSDRLTIRELSRAIDNDTGTLQWIHLPSNNLALVQACFDQLGLELGSEITNMRLRPTFSHRGMTASFVPPHAIHMEATCFQGHVPPMPRQQGRKADKWLPSLTVYLPYLNWTYYSHYKRASRAEHNPLQSARRTSSSDRRRASGNSSSPGDIPMSTGSAGTSKSRKSPYSKPSRSKPLNFLENSVPHRSRTLDQFYYPALSDTSARDATQTISKWSGNDAFLPADGRSMAVHDSLLMMVDQLWSWVIDDELIITCSRETEILPRQTTPEDYIPDFQTLYKSVHGEIEMCFSAWDVHAVILKGAMNYMFSEQNKSVRNIVETYKWVSCKKTASQILLLENFNRKYAKGGYDASIFDDRTELNLLLEIVDIIDELKMITALLNIQKELLAQYSDATGKINPYTSTVEMVTTFTTSSSTITHILDELAEINQNAEYTHKMLMDLLNLKSNAASLAEARASVKQGKAVMLFTIITIIFLPLSFFTSYFGQNIREITGDEKNPPAWHLWRVATPISVVTIVTALVVALLIMSTDPGDWIYKRSKNSRTGGQIGVRAHSVRDEEQRNI